MQSNNMLEKASYMIISPSLFKLIKFYSMTPEHPSEILSLFYQAFRYKSVKLKIIFLFFNLNIYFGYSKELSQ